MSRQRGRGAIQEMSFMEEKKKKTGSLKKKKKKTEISLFFFCSKFFFTFTTSQLGALAFPVKFSTLSYGHLYAYTIDYMPNDLQSLFKSHTVYTLIKGVCLLI